MRYSETGFNLEVDLPTGNIEMVPTDPKLTELHLGGSILSYHFTMETLRKYALDYVGEALAKRGILSGDDGYSSKETSIE